MIKEVNKGYAYRLYICDSVPSEKVREDKEKVLQCEVFKLFKDAKVPKILTSDSISAWINRYPGLIARFFKPYLKNFSDISFWGQQVRVITQVYVHNPEWDNIK
jgi:hypothetical protein